MTRLDSRRIGIYLLVAFGFTWGLDLIIYLNGGLRDSPELLAGTGITLALALMTLSMFGPALGHVVTRLVTREGWRDLGLRPHFKREWRFWLLIWLIIPILIAAGALLYFLFFRISLTRSPRCFASSWPPWE